MTVIDIIVNTDGTIEEVERELTPQEEDWAINGEPEPDPADRDPMESIDAMLVDHEYRLTLMELGITDFNMEV